MARAWIAAVVVVAAVMRVATVAHGTGVPPDGTLFVTALNDTHPQQSYITSISGRGPFDWSRLVTNDSPGVLNDVFSGVDVAYNQSTVFITSRKHQSIEAYPLDGRSPYQVFHPISRHVKSIAVDWVSNNVYWADPLYNWIALTKTTAYKEGFYAVVLKDVHSPHGVAVHPGKGYLFWTDNGEVPKIERCTLSGKYRTVLLDTNLYKPTALLVDYDSDLLYWADAYTGRVYSMSIDGEGRHLAYHWLPGPVDLALYHGFLYISDEVHRMIAVYRTTNGSRIQTGFNMNGRIPKSLVMFDQSRQPNYPSACAYKGCEEFCVNDPGGTATCICSHGKHLQPDGVTCSRFDRFHPPFFVYSHGWTVCQLPAYFPNHISGVSNNDCILPVRDHNDYGALAFDIYTETIFVAEEANKVIYAVRDNERMEIASGFGRIQGMSVDWINSNLYWTDFMLNHIKVADERGRHQHVLLKDLDSPRGIVVDALRGRLYWCGGKDRYHWYIRFAHLDGSDARDFVSYRHFNVTSQPTSMTIDYEENKLYWTDSLNNHINSASLDSESPSINTIYADTGFYSNVSNIYDVETFQDYVLWTDNSAPTHGVYAAVKGGSKVKALHQNNGNVHDVLLYDYSKQPLNDSSGEPNKVCAFQNGGCEQMCLPRLTGRTCKCAIGYTLAADGASCRTGRLTDNFMLLADTGLRTIFQLSLDTEQLYALPIVNLDEPVAIGYDPVDQRVYWSDAQSSPPVVKSSLLDGTDARVLVHSTGLGAQDLKIDSISRVMYIVEPFENAISIVTLNGTEKKTLIKTKTTDTPKRIEIDIVNGYLYWSSDSSTGSRITRSYLDGTHHQVLVEHPHDIHSVRGLSLDPTRKHLYWVDIFFNKIEVILLEGDVPFRSRTIVDYANYYEDDNWPIKRGVYGVALNNDQIFYNDFHNESIWWLEADDSVEYSDNDGELDAERFGPEVFGSVSDIKIFNSSHHIEDSNRCSHNNGGCSHHCLPTPNGATCACEDGISLHSDELTCVYPTEKHGNWSQWTPWSSCSRSCGYGERVRSRTCTQPQHGGDPCSGPSKEWDSCKVDCPVNGSWSPWGPWSECSVSCGSGAKQRVRTCTHPAPLFGGHDCVGDAFNVSECSQGACIPPSTWGSWTRWSLCSKTCGPGEQTRRRACNGSQQGGGPCTGDSFHVRTCNVTECPVHGYWAEWSEWSPCSASCDNGTKTRTRSCTEPKHGGSICSGERTASVRCQTTPCEINGTWSQWSRWSECSKTCGAGRQTRTRTCREPQYGGAWCEGDSTSNRTCKVSACLGYGVWLSWGPWSACSASCAGGIRTRRRACRGTLFSGECIGSDEESLGCNVHLCPVNGTWGPWDSWSKCSASCGHGLKTRKRSCNGPFLGGADCVGNSTSSGSCHAGICPVDGGWSGWEEWSPCSHTCGGGFTSRQRQCNSPPPSNGGNTCTGSPYGSAICNGGPCDVTTDWEPWSGCSATCGDGEMTRKRICIENSSLNPDEESKCDTPAQTKPCSIICSSTDIVSSDTGKQNEGVDKADTTIPVIAGASAGGLVLIIAIVVTALVVCRKMKLNAQERLAQQAQSLEFTNIPPPDYTDRSNDNNYTYPSFTPGGSVGGHGNEAYVKIEPVKVGNRESHLYDTCLPAPQENSTNDSMYETLSRYHIPEASRPPYNVTGNDESARRPSAQDIFTIRAQPSRTDAVNPRFATKTYKKRAEKPPAYRP